MLTWIGGLAWANGSFYIADKQGKALHTVGTGGTGYVKHDLGRSPREVGATDNTVWIVGGQ